MEWISVEDRLPEDCVGVLCFNGYYSFIAHHAVVSDVWIGDDEIQCHIRPTHWILIPELPKENK